MARVSAHDVANFFLYLDSFEPASEGISNLKMHKLLYYAQGFYMAIHQELLFDDIFEAWAYGPVIPSLYQVYEIHGKNMIPMDKTADTDLLTYEQKTLVKEVYDEFAQYSAWRLKDMTHEEMPWLSHAHQESIVIPTEDIKSYFRTRI